MNQALLEAFRHSAWATSTLIAVFRQLSPAELERPARGYGTLLATLNHVVLSDASYAAILTGVRPDWARRENPTADLDQLEARANETAQVWERFLSVPVDGELMLELEAGRYRCHASVVVAQALHHACAHREQVRGGLADIGMKTQDLQPWEYALATGRAHWRDADETE